VLVVEKGEALPRDGSTLDVDAVMRRGAFLSTERWVIAEERSSFPRSISIWAARPNGTALRCCASRPHEFEADAAHRCLAWPIGYDDLAPFYDEAERLLGVRTFAAEPALERLVSGLEGLDRRWTRQTLMVGLHRDILDHPEEAEHFDAFASVRGIEERCRNVPVRSRARAAQPHDRPPAKPCVR
jgi:choline dehydrogenase-like flavoprotein